MIPIARTGPTSRGAAAGPAAPATVGAPAVRPEAVHREAA
jgi:hypothetical protein